MAPRTPIVHDCTQGPLLATLGDRQEQILEEMREQRKEAVSDMKDLRADIKDVLAEMNRTTASVHTDIELIKKEQSNQSSRLDKLAEANAVAIANAQAIDILKREQDDQNDRLDKLENPGWKKYVFEIIAVVVGGCLIAFITYYANRLSLKPEAEARIEKTVTETTKKTANSNP